MAISLSDNDPRVRYTATSGQTVFSVPFEFFDDDDLDVFVEDTAGSVSQKTLTTDYTVSGGNGSTGSITFGTGITLDHIVSIVRNIDIERVTDFTGGTAINRAALNEQLDKLTAITADIKDVTTRSLRLADWDADVSMTLPSISQRSGKIFGFDTSGNLTVGVASNFDIDLDDLTVNTFTIAYSGTPGDGSFFRVNADADSKLISENGTLTLQSRKSSGDAKILLDGSSSFPIDIDAVGGNIRIQDRVQFESDALWVVNNNALTFNFTHTGPRTITFPDLSGTLLTSGGSPTFTNVTITGDLTVSGTTTTVNSTNVNIGDNIITLNSDETGTPSQDAGIEVERGTASNKTFVWDETNDKWSIGTEGLIAATIQGSADIDLKPLGGQVNLLGTAGQQRIAFSNFESPEIEIYQNSYSTKLVIENPTASRTITFPDATGTVALTDNVIADLVNDTTPQLGGTLDLNGNRIEDSNQIYLKATGTADIDLQAGGGQVNILDGSGNQRIAINNDATPSIRFYQNSYTIDLDITTLTAARTITFPDSTGTVALTSQLYTDSDFDTRLAAKSTSDLSEGTNLYYTDARAQAVSINNLSEDTTPQLGGTLDLNGNRIEDSAQIYLKGTNTADIDLQAAGGQVNILGTSGEQRITFNNDATPSLDAYGAFSIDGNNTISLSSTGDFTVDSSGDIILDADGGQVYFKDGGVTKYTFHTGSPKLTTDGNFMIETSSSSLDFKAGSGNYDFLTNSGAQAIQLQGTGTPEIRFYQDSFTLDLDVTTLTAARTITFPNATGTVALTNNVLSNVVEDTTPQLGGDLASNGNDILFGDNDKAIFGAGSDLQIYHSSSTSFIKDAGQGDLSIQTNGNEIAVWNSADGEYMARFVTGGTANLYHSGSTKLSTTSTGVDISGSVTTSGQLLPAAGAVSAPSYSFDGDTNTGISRPTGDAVNIITGGQERMRIDAGGSVLIGATTPTDLHNTWNHIIIGDKGSIISQDGAGGIDGMTISSNAYIDADTGAYAYITTDEATKITQENGNITFNYAASGTAGNAITFSTSMKIDSSGNLLVGGTDTFPHDNSATSGTAIGASGYLSIARSGGISGYFNRMSSDGDIVQFRKDGTTVGSIGTSTNQMYIGHSDTGIRFTATADDIRPWDPSTGAIRDAAIDLGDSAGRFKDLYLSNSVKVMSATNGTSIIDLGDTDDNDIGRIAYDNSVNEMYFKTNNSEAMRIDNSGDITIGGTVTAASFTATSDINLKKDLAVVDNALDKVKSLTGYTYTLKENEMRSAGLIAQDVEKVLPEAVRGEEGSKALDYNATIALLVNAIKEQQAEIDMLKSRLGA